MPSNYASALVAKIQFSLETTAADTDTAAFQVAVMAVTPNVDEADIVTPSFDTDNAGTLELTADQVAGYLKEISITLTNADSVAAGDLVAIQVYRDVANDGVVDDLEVVAISLEYTTS